MNINTGHKLFINGFYKSFSFFIVVIILSLLPSDDSYKISIINIPFLDKIIHFCMYFTLVFLILIDTKKTIKKPIKNYTLSVILAVILLVAIIEIIQELFIDGRFGSFFDFFANCIGVFFGIIAFRLHYKKNLTH